MLLFGSWLLGGDYIITPPSREPALPRGVRPQFSTVSTTESSGSRPGFLLNRPDPFRSQALSSYLPPLPKKTPHRARRKPGYHCHCSARGLCQLSLSLTRRVLSDLD